MPLKETIVLFTICIVLLVLGSVLFVYGILNQITDALLLGFFLGMVGIVLTIALIQAQKNAP